MQEGSYAGWGHVDADLFHLPLWPSKIEAFKTDHSTIMDGLKGCVKAILSHVYLWEVPLSLQVREDPQVSQMQPA